MRFAFAGCLMALMILGQPAALPELKIDAITGGSVLLVRNTSSKALMSCLIELVDYPGSSFAYWLDQPLPPGAEKRIETTNMTIGAVPDYVKMRAALYADGSTAGGPDKVALMMGRRKAQLEVVKRLEAGEDVGALLESLKQEGKPKYDSPAWVNRAGQYALAMQVKQRLTSEPRAAVIAALKANLQEGVESH